MDKLSERIRRPAQDASFDGDVYAIRGEWFEEMANEVAQLEAEIAIQHKYQANMMDEDAQPLPEWIAYFDELEALESGGE